MKLNFNPSSKFSSFSLRTVLISAMLASGTFAQAQTTYTWDGSEGDNKWSNPLNWTPVRATPVASDVLSFNGNTVANATVNVDFAGSTESIGVLYVRFGAQVTFLMPSSKVLSITGNGTTAADIFVDASSKLTFSNSVQDASLTLAVAAGNTARIDGIVELASPMGSAAHQLSGADVNTFRFIDGSTFISGAGVTGEPFGSSATVARALFQSGSTYINQAQSHPFGSGSVGATTFQSGSTYVHRTNAAINLGGRYYGDIVVDQPNYTAVSEGSNGVLNVNNFTVLQGNSLLVSHDAGTIIRGNITVNSGSLTFSPSGGSQNFLFRGTGIQTVSATGTGQLIFGNNCKVIVEASYQLQLLSNITVRNVMQIWGLLDAQNYIITSDTNTGSFSLISGGTLYTSHPEGITLRPSMAGTVQVPGNRSYATGTYRYYGNSAQVTGDGIPANLNILTVENTGGLTLNKNVKIINQLNLIVGKLFTTSSSMVTVDYTGEVSEASALSFVHGPMAIVVAQSSPISLLYPVGKGNEYRPVTLSLTQADATATTYTAEYKNQAPPTYTLPSTMKKVSTVRYFTITSNSAAGLVNGYITMPFTNDEGFGVSHPEGVGIAKSDGNGGWEDLGGTHDPDAGTIENAVSFAKFSDFAFGFTINTLPVSLISLDAAAKQENVLVNWSTSKEENNAYFEVQRSKDGVSFQTIGKVEGMGNSANRNDYAFTDYQPVSGVAYYRLRQVDFDGTASFHGPVAVRRATSSIAQLDLYPNPAIQSATLSFEAETDQTATLRIVNAIGQTVLQQQVSATKGYNAVTVPVNKLQTGMYVVEMITESGVSATRLVKQ